MATDIPKGLTEGLPQNKWGKVLGATPVVMTVIATALAGLSSSEMNRAQYDRAWAAQLQSKASDQWSFFQFKRLRGVLQGDVADMQLAQRVADKDATPAAPIAFQTKSAVADMPATVQTAIQASAAGKPDETLDELAAKITPEELSASRKLAVQRQQAFDAEVQAANAARLNSQGRLRFAAARYEAEARLDQDVAYLTELEVRKSNQGAKRHHARSQEFFIGMLVAQMAVVISTFALATARHSILWSIGAAAGVAALFFAIYVYLWT